MMKRLLMLALSLLLLTCAAAGAEQAYANVENALYRIVLRSGEADIPLGSGVLYGDQQTLLTALSCCPAGDLYALSADGEHAVRSMEAAEDVALLRLATPASGEPLPLADGDMQALPYLFGASAAGQLGAMPVYAMQEGRLGTQDTAVLVSEEGLLPGGLMVDEQGAIVGLTVAQHMEGVGLYVLLDAAALRHELTASEEDNTSTLDIAFSWLGGELVIAWEDEERTAGSYLCVISGEENRYFQHYTLGTDLRSVPMAVPPGHAYRIAVQYVPRDGESPALDWAAMSVYTIPEATFAAHGFSQQCWLASVPAGTAVDSPLPEMTEITAQALTDPAQDIYFQIRCTYFENIEDEMPMALELIAPDGQFYFEQMGFLFDPELAQDDSFALPMDALLDQCATYSGGTLLPGEYRVRYALNGQIAGEYPFTLSVSP